MRGAWGVAVLLLWLPWEAVDAQPTDRPLRLAPLPLESTELVVRQFQPLVDHLQRRLGQPIELVLPGFHDDVLRAFVAGEIDVAFLGPLPYLALRQMTPDAVPLVRFIGSDGQGMYRCALVAFAGEPIEPSQLVGAPVGLTQPLSTCGYLGTAAILQAVAGIDLAQTDYRYLGSHEAVALAVVAGDVVAGGVKDEFADKYASLGLEVVAWSERVPGVALIANGATLPAVLIERIRGELLATPETTYRSWGTTLRHGMEPAVDHDFDGLRTFGDIEAIPATEGP